MFKIGDFSKISNLTVRALHHYEKLGLLIPEHVDGETNYRFYSAKQLETANKIKFMQQLGLSLKSIGEVLNSEDMSLLENYYAIREEEIGEELEELKKKQSIIKIYRENIKGGNEMEKYNVGLKEVPNRRVMSIRRVLPGFNDEGTLWNELYGELMRQNVKMTNPPMGMTLFHDKEYREEDVEVEVQSTIEGDYDDTDDVKFFDAEGFTMASVTFSGSFEQMPEVTQAIGQWIEVNGYVISGPMVNISIVSPAQDPNPENWVTEAGFVVVAK